MLEVNKIYNMDCLEGLKLIDDNSIDLIVTDPHYLIESTNPGDGSRLAKSMQGYNEELKNNELTKGITNEHLKEMVRVMKNINAYIWCNHKQIPQYIDFFVGKHKCKFDIIVWNKTNALPLFNNKYLTDKEYCLYFRKNAYCNPSNYESAKTVYYQPINVKDKKLYKHPTIKPINIITNLIKNSSKENDLILDPFIGSGTTAVSAYQEKRNYIGFEISREYYDIARERIKENKQQLSLF